MKFLFVSILLVILFSCKKSEPVPASDGEITIDLQNNKVQFHLERVHFLTDSVYLKFETETLYDCNQYKLNANTQQLGNNTNILLGNIYRDGGFCVWGLFPAVHQYKSAAFKNGNYTLSVKKNNTTYKGTLTVTDTDYKINWSHDDIMEINPKILLK